MGEKVEPLHFRIILRILYLLSGMLIKGVDGLPDLMRVCYLKMLVLAMYSAFYIVV
jgi:hypothetical protein